MLKEISQFIRKSAAQIFTWPNRYRSEEFGSSYTAAGQAVTPENALTSSTVAACVRLLSETMASLPLHIYRDTGKSKFVATDHPMYDMLRFAPNDFQTNWTFIQEAMTHCLLHGNFYAFIERDSSGNPSKLWPLNPRGVILEAVDGTVRYRYFFGGKRDLYSFRDILHLKGLSLDGLIGHSVISMAREGIGLALAQDRHGAGPDAQ